MRIMRALAVLALGVATISVAPQPACADTWMLPEKTSYASCGGQARVTVTPRALESQLAYFEDKVRKSRSAGQKRGGAAAASARVERLIDGRWQPLWEGKIANEVAPVSAIVRDDGQYVVTFDDWHMMGYGPNVVAIYGVGGVLVRALALSDLVPGDYLRAMPRSVSSVQWRGEPRFSPDGARVIIPVTIPSADFTMDHARVELAVTLADGAVAPVDANAWAAALAAGRVALAAQVAAEAAAKAAFLAPLTRPQVNEEREWHDYLNEAVARLRGDDASASTTVLRAPDAADYAASEGWVQEALGTERYSDEVAIASISEPNLVTVLERAAATLPRRSLSKVTVFIALSDPYWPGAVAAMQGTGAKLVQLDPDTPIPQRRERIARRAGE